MYRYIYILIFSVLIVCCAHTGYAQVNGNTVTGYTAPADTLVVDTTGTTDSNKQIKKTDLAGHQLAIGIDIVNPITNALVSDHYGYEFEMDYYKHNEFYLVAEGGWGGSNVSYSDLKYTTTNPFLRLGFNKTMLVRDNPKDWDMMLIGLRLGYAHINHSLTNYIITDSTWGNTSGFINSKPIDAVWLEVTGGMRVEFVKNFFAGWNIRGKFMMDGKSFANDAPLFIAGYGRGDKNAVFDFNLYISYAIRWDRKKTPAATKATNK